ncbi:response regulator [Pseudocnuella soli]|uniref:response regulator n=1 Tax=Pseudocnuella soli TaxID=2502779 RepID=UPI0010459A13|nr:response regulator [Pseudocnuella soli]
MQQENPVLVLDDDLDDQEMIREAAEKLDIRNEFIFFKTGDELINHLHETSVSPFFILCDVNLSGSNGFEVRIKLMEDETVRYKSVPFIFWSNHASEKQIRHAYDLPAQGFFFKSNKFEDLCETLATIVAYWKHSQHPKRL